MNRINIPLSIIEDDLSSYLKLGIQATLARHDEKFKMVASSLGENLEKKDGKLIFEDIRIWISVYQETIDELSYLVPLISAMTEDIHQCLIWRKTVSLLTAGVNNLLFSP